MIPKDGIISAETRVFGIFGDPVSHSLSPAMHNAAFIHKGIDGVYLPFRVVGEDLATAVDSLRALGIAGVNVTVPHKHAVGKYIDRLMGDAALTGSVNTIINKDGILTGYSTDGVGLLRSLREEAKWGPNGNTAIILGTGGAAAAVAFRLVQEGLSRLLILGRNQEKIVRLVKEIATKTGYLPESGRFDEADLGRRVKEFSLVINTTPLGMKTYNSGSMPPLPPSWTAPDALLCDLVYNPLNTQWLKEADALGRKTLSGIGMLLYQGAEAFEIWTDIEAPLDIMRQALLKAIS
jgi:shikimate dehydrogenase